MASPALVAPVFLWDPEARDLLVFESAEAAARHLEPWQEVGTLAAYDAEGRRIGFAVERRSRLLLGLIPAAKEVVVVGEVEREPRHAGDLRRAIVASLARRGTDGEVLEGRSLPDLVTMAASARRA
jgi:hypothetical protein